MSISNEIERLVGAVEDLVETTGVDFTKLDPEQGIPDGLPEALDYKGNLHGLHWAIDPEVGEAYVTVGLSLNPAIEGFTFVEIDDGTYGALQGIRVYLG